MSRRERHCIKNNRLLSACDYNQTSIKASNRSSYTLRTFALTTICELEYRVQSTYTLLMFPRHRSSVWGIAQAQMVPQYKKLYQTNCQSLYGGFHLIVHQNQIRVSSWTFSQLPSSELIYSSTNNLTTLQLTVPTDPDLNAHCVSFSTSFFILLAKQLKLLLTEIPIQSLCSPSSFRCGSLGLVQVTDTISL